MSYIQPGTLPIGVANSAVETRAKFIMRTYAHLFLAILAFTGIEVFLFQAGIAPRIAETLLGGSWLLVLGGFVIAGMLASRLAHNTRSLPAQYAGLGLSVVAYSIIFVPMLYLAQSVAPGAIQSAAVVTLIGFAGLTAVAFISKKDFSFLGGLIKWGGILAIVTIVAGAIFGFQLGTFFSVAMVGLAGAAILWDTSNVLHHFPADRYVGAATELFGSVAMMFWYILRIFMSRD